MARQQQRQESGGGTAVATRPAAAPPPAARDLLALMEQYRPKIEALLPRHLTAERMIRVALATCNRSEGLRKCSQLSILNAVIQASEVGLEPGGALKHAYLIPYGAECQFQVSYMGMLELARRSGEYRVIEARTIQERDRFALRYTPAPEFVHEPALDDAGELTHAYAYAVLTNGATVLEIATRKEIEAARAQSKQPTSLMWSKFYAEGAKKVVLKKMLKRQPCSVEMARAIEIDNGDRDFDDRPGRAALAGPHASKSARLAAALAPPEPEPEPAFAPGTAGRITTEPPEDDGRGHWPDEDEEPERQSGEEG